MTTKSIHQQLRMATSCMHITASEPQLKSPNALDETHCMLAARNLPQHSYCCAPFCNTPCLISWHMHPLVMQASAMRLASPGAVLGQQMGERAEVSFCQILAAAAGALYGTHSRKQHFQQCSTATCKTYNQQLMHLLQYPTAAMHTVHL